MPADKGRTILFFTQYKIECYCMVLYWRKDKKQSSWSYAGMKKYFGATNNDRDMRVV